MSQTSSPADQQQLNQLAASAPLPLLLVDAEDGRIRHSNQLARDCLQDQEQHPLLAEHFHNPQLARQLLLMAKNQGFVAQFEARLYQRPQQWRWMQLAARRVGPQGELLAIALTDIHTRKLRELELAASAARHRAILASTHEGYVLVNADNLQVLDVNPALCHMLGQPASDLLGQALPSLFANDATDQARLQQLAENQRGDRRHWAFEARLRHASGQLVTTQINASALIDQQDGEQVEPHALFALITDIGERKLNEDRLYYLAFYDNLTALPNRYLLGERLEQMTRQQQRGGAGFALLFIDLDDFKQVNDRHGHDVGDELLQLFARRLAGLLRSSDTASRLAGDEFVVLLANIADSDTALVVAEKLIAALGQPLQLQQQALAVSLSVGIALCPQHATDPAQLKHLADHAMYAAKRQGKNRAALHGG